MKAISETDTRDPEQIAFLESPTESSTPGQDDGELRGPPKFTGGARQPGAREALLVLTCINGLNYVDRYLPGTLKSWSTPLPFQGQT